MVICMHLIDAVYGYLHALGAPWCVSKELGVLGYPSINLNLTFSTALFPPISKHALSQLTKLVDANTISPFSVVGNRNKKKYQNKKEK